MDSYLNIPGIIDLRSDTVTVPTQEMLEAMQKAQVGDDVYGDDPTVNLLEEKSADILGKEAALFVPSGTFGNQLALLTHTCRGEEVMLPEDCHIILYEVGASSVIAGVQLRTLHSENGKINIKELEKYYRHHDIHYPETGLICMENAYTSGTVIPIANMRDVHEFALSRNVPVHLDGARIFNAAIALGVKAEEIAQYFDSVMFCFSKGLCAPVGSVLTGKRDFINKARKNRKLMGGGMRQAGYIAAPCIIALEKMVDRLEQDHANAKYMAEKLENTGYFDIAVDRLDINMVFFRIKPFIKNLTDFNEVKFIKFLSENRIKINPLHEDEFRFVTHYYINRGKIDLLVEFINKYMESIKENR